MPLKGSYQFSHVGIPLKMKASYSSSVREAFIRLNEFNVLHKRGKRIILKITSSEVLREIASLVREPSKPYDFYLWDLQLFYTNYLHMH